MDNELDDQDRPEGQVGSGGRRVRADAQRNLDGLLQAAMKVFASAGVDAPVREIAKEAGVGVGTLYRHFPQRSDLIAAAFRREIEACADAAPVLAAENEPGDALALWMQRYVDFVSAKRGIGAALHSGDPAYAALPQFFETRLKPALAGLLKAGAEAGQVRAGVDAEELLIAAAKLSAPGADGDTEPGRRMVSLLVDGLRFGARG